jgi:transmembrane sensor
LPGKASDDKINTPWKFMQKEFIEMLDRYLAGKATPEEEKLAEEWYAALNKQWTGSQKVNFPENLKARVLSHAQKTGKAETKDAPSKIKYLLWSSAAAAVLLISALVIFALTTKRNDHSRDLAEQKISDWKTIENSGQIPHKITLADGSKVTLKTGSRLKFPQQFITPNREVYLEGEAFFEVERDPAHPFIVYANDVVTKVLGTTFTITAFEADQKVTVSVRTGKVSVYKKSEAAENKQIILAPNQQAVYDKSIDKVARMLVQEPVVILPADELIKMRFEDAPVTEIFDALEKAYGVDILYDQSILSGCSLTTSLLDETLYIRLNIICRAIGATYTISETQIVIESTGCH